MRRFSFVLVVVLLVASCAGEPVSTTIEPTTPEPTMTTGSTPTSTTQVLVEWPSYLVYGWSGIDRVAGSGLSDYQEASVKRLVSDPVLWATGDGAGGVVFQSATEEPGWVWFPADGDRPRQIDLGDAGWPGVELVASFAGRPSVVVTRSFEGMDRCRAEEELVEEVVVRDLASGEEQFVACRNLSQDVGEGFGSFGGGLFTVIPDIGVGPFHTSGALRFVDLSGDEVLVEHNPFAESCAPCELDALLSPDGSLLAYALWRTSFLQSEDIAGGDYAKARSEWWETAQHVPTELVVMDLATGDERWRSQWVAQARLDSFDGRFITVTANSRRVIYDTQTGERVGIPPATTPPEAFWTAVLASLDTATHDYAIAQIKAGELESELAVETGVVWSDGWLTMEAGYWAVITGRYESRLETASRCSDLGIGARDCYPKYLATEDTIDPEVGLALLQLRPDGLGVVDLEDPAGGVVDLLGRFFGSAPADGGPSAAWVKYVGWTDHGLFLGFSTPQWTDWDGVSRLIGWSYSLGWPSGRDDPSIEFQTADGVTIGTTVANLRELYGESLRLPAEEDVCSGWVLSLPDGVLATLNGPPSDTAQVVGLSAGVGVGC